MSLTASRNCFPFFCIEFRRGSYQSPSPWNPSVKDSEDFGLSHFKPASTISRERIAFRSRFSFCVLFLLTWLAMVWLEIPRHLKNAMSFPGGVWQYLEDHPSWGSDLTMVSTSLTGVLPLPNGPNGLDMGNPNYFTTFKSCDDPPSMGIFLQGPPTEKKQRSIPTD